MAEHARTISARVIAAFACTLLALLAGGLGLYLAQRDCIRHEAEANLATVARLKIAQIVQWRAERLGDAAVISESPYIAKAFARSVSERPGSPVGELLTVLRSIREHHHYGRAMLDRGDGEQG